jgi:hypothetical protein
VIPYPEIGMRFGRLVVIGHGKRSNGVRYATTQCDCGKTTSPAIYDLWSGRSKSCGCKAIEGMLAKVRKHGMSRKRVYENWCKIKGRCYNPKDTSFKNYGARGITMSPEWRASFDAFYKDMGDPPAGMTIDRINNDLGYSFENCRWATNKEQQYNKTNNVQITFNGETKPLGKWAEELGFKYHTLEGRIRNYGWGVERAMTTPVKGAVENGR